MKHELAAGWAGVGRGDRDFAAELIRLVSLAFGDALDLRGMQAVELPAAPADLQRFRPLMEALRNSTDAFA